MGIGKGNKQRSQGEWEGSKVEKLREEQGLIRILRVGVSRKYGERK